MAEHPIERAGARRIPAFSIGVVLQMLRNGMEAAGIGRSGGSPASASSLERTQ